MQVDLSSNLGIVRKVGGQPMQQHKEHYLVYNSA